MSTAFQLPPATPQRFNTAAKIGFRPADNHRRVAAFVIDMILSGILGVVIGGILKAAHLGDFTNLIIQSLLTSSIYWVLLTVEFGATPGKKMMGLKILAVEGDLTYGKLFYREAVARPISGIVLFMGYIWVLTNPERKTWHDIMAKTRVVDYRE